MEAHEVDAEEDDKELPLALRVIFNFKKYGMRFKFERNIFDVLFCLFAPIYSPMRYFRVPSAGGPKCSLKRLTH